MIGNLSLKVAVVIHSDSSACRGICAEAYGSRTPVASTMCAGGKDCPATDCWFRESGGCVHEVFDEFGDCHAFWTLGFGAGTWQIYSSEPRRVLRLNGRGAKTGGSETSKMNAVNAVS